jgi:hypothetical protein
MEECKLVAQARGMLFLAHAGILRSSMREDISSMKECKIQNALALTGGFFHSDLQNCNFQRRDSL